MKNTLYFIAIALFSLTACKNEPTPEEVQLQTQIETYERLKSEAEEIHDIVMVKGSEMMELVSEIEAKTESGELAEYNPEKIVGVVRYIKKADKDMMSWMQDYSSKFPYGDPSPETKEALEEKLPILEQEVKEIVQLKERTMEAIEKAQELLKK
jgi:hypothetical protein